MAVVNIAAFMICLFYFSYLWKKTLVEILPVLACMLVFVLYVFALIGRLSLIDEAAFIIIASFIIWLIIIKQEKRAEFRINCLNNMTQVSFATAILLILFVTLCTSHKVVTWWDDINFWATDVKSLYYLDGFASKYGNVAPEFGDYPPAGQLIKWWFLHFSPHDFREGLAFAGYYVMNIVFMLPVLKNLKEKNIIINVLMAAALWFLPSIAEAYTYNGFCADLTMACVYGAFLSAVVDKPEKTNKPEVSYNARELRSQDNFYYIRLALYLGVLVLIKSVGFIWAAFGLVFFFVYNARNRGGIIKKLSVIIIPLTAGGSWLAFCLIMRRVTKTTATAVKYITTDEYGLSGYMGDYAKAFLEAFIKLPLHQEKSALINFSPLAFYICICLIVILFYKKGLMPKRQGRIVLWFGIISGALFYGIIFAAHITIFASETQYLEASGMISSIERYGAPFTIGMLIFLADIWLEYGGCIFDKAGKKGLKSSVLLHKYGTYIVFILFTALTAGYGCGYYGLVGYRADVEQQLEYRAQMPDEDARTFLASLREAEDVRGLDTAAVRGTRICYIQRDTPPRWVINSYTSFEASPISVVYRSVNLEDAPSEWMAQEIRASHASYLYVENTEADAGAVFDEMTPDGDFVCEKLYRIEDDGTKLYLFSVQ